jgi:hypothetical protein
VCVCVCACVCVCVCVCVFVCVCTEYIGIMHRLKARHVAFPNQSAASMRP